MPRNDETSTVREGFETLPEPLDPALPDKDDMWRQADADLDEALRETFPASDPIASGHIA
ncbi:hypothetical protein ACFFP0_09705 [Rhizobium puerariae]|uniref:Uncharacterized protein n=1 Tax=Rhizobium puerariae TaxID=1585791 RepID=A0ABV6AEX8_9HYPH